MPYTYAEPVNGVFPTPTSEVRFLLADTTPAAPFSLSDAEIEYILTRHDGEVALAAGDVAFQMGTRYSAESATASKSVGNLSLSYNYAGLADRYYGLAATLRSGRDRSARVAGPVFFEAETQFTIGQFDHPRR